MEELVDVESASHLTFKLDGFDGPLDLLLHLVNERNVEIKDVKLADLTEQYMQYMKDVEELNMDDATAFLDMLSRLLLIKSRVILPKDELPSEEEEIDDETLIKMQLEEYKLFKEAGGNLQKFENINRLYKMPDKTVGDTRIVFNQFNLDKLLDAFAFILMRTKNKEENGEKKIARDRWTVADKMNFLTNVLKDNAEINFFSLFDDSYSRSEVITVFMAILELLKFQKIEVVQAERYADILIKRKEEKNDDWGNC